MSEVPLYCMGHKAFVLCESISFSNMRIDTPSQSPHACAAMACSYTADLRFFGTANPSIGSA